MEDVRIEEVTENLRIRIVYDTSPDEPYDDGGAPILRIGYNNGRWSSMVEQVDKVSSYVLPERLVTGFTEMLDRHDIDVAKRYLRIFWGARNFDDERTRDYEYLAFDPEHWRQAMELTDEYIASREADGVTMRLGTMDEYRAYLNGDVYGYIIEKRVTWVKKDEPEVEREEWEETDSCWGFYGDADYAVEAAKDNLPE
jgi:hypothetical protein